MQEILYDDDPIWHDSALSVFDPRRLAWIDSEDRLNLRQFLSGKPPLPTETVQVSYPTPRQAVLKARLESPGMVVLADTYYPGWKLSIDGKPAPIYKVNRVMRGAAVEAGRHTLVFRYDPGSFRLGWRITMGGLVAAVLLAVLSGLRPRARLTTEAGNHPSGLAS